MKAGAKAHSGLLVFLLWSGSLRHGPDVLPKHFAQMCSLIAGEAPCVCSSIASPQQSHQHLATSINTLAKIALPT